MAGRRARAMPGTSGAGRRRLRGRPAAVQRQGRLGVRRADAAADPRAAGDAGDGRRRRSIRRRRATTAAAGAASCATSTGSGPSSSSGPSSVAGPATAWSARPRSRGSRTTAIRPRWRASGRSRRPRPSGPPRPPTPERGRRPPTRVGRAIAATTVPRRRPAPISAANGLARCRPGDEPATSGPRRPGPARRRSSRRSTRLGKEGVWRIGGHELKLTNLDKVDSFDARSRPRDPDHQARADRLLRADRPDDAAAPAPIGRSTCSGSRTAPARPGFWQKDIPSTAPAWLPRWHETGVDGRARTATPTTT